MEDIITCYNNVIEPLKFAVKISQIEKRIVEGIIMVRLRTHTDKRSKCICYS